MFVSGIGITLSTGIKRIAVLEIVMQLHSSRQAEKCYTVLVRTCVCYFSVELEAAVYYLSIFRRTRFYLEHSMCSALRPEYCTQVVKYGTKANISAILRDSSKWITEKYSRGESNYEIYIYFSSYL